MANLDLDFDLEVIARTRAHRKTFWQIFGGRKADARGCTLKRDAL